MTCPGFAMSLVPEESPEKKGGELSEQEGSDSEDMVDIPENSCPACEQEYGAIDEDRQFEICCQEPV